MGSRGGGGSARSATSAGRGQVTADADRAQHAADVARARQALAALRAGRAGLRLQPPAEHRDLWVLADDRGMVAVARSLAVIEQVIAARRLTSP